MRGSIPPGAVFPGGGGGDPAFSGPTGANQRIPVAEEVLLKDMIKLVNIASRCAHDAPRRRVLLLPAPGGDRLGEIRKVMEPGCDPRWPASLFFSKEGKSVELLRVCRNRMEPPCSRQTTRTSQRPWRLPCPPAPPSTQARHFAALPRPTAASEALCLPLPTLISS